MNIRLALADSETRIKKSGIPTYQLDSEVLLSFVLTTERSYLFAHPEKNLNARLIKRFFLLVKKRCQRVPIAYLTKKKYFFGHEFIIGQSVLIPRPDTEILVATALDYISLHPERKNLLDIGTGSGCIAISLALSSPSLKVYATDLSAAALAQAKINCAKYKLNTSIQLSKASLYPPSPHVFDIIVSNPPYLSHSEYRASLKKYPEMRYEPRLALVATNNGFVAIESIIRTCHTHLAEQGVLFLEIGSSQRARTIAAVKKYLPEATVTFYRDLAARTRVAHIAMQAKK